MLLIFDLRPWGRELCLPVSVCFFVKGMSKLLGWMSNKLFVLCDIPPPSNPSGGRRLLWTVALQVPLSMGFPKQEHWNGLSCPPPGGLPKPGIQPVSPVAPALQVDSLSLSHQGRSLLSATVSIFLMIPSASMDCLWPVRCGGRKDLSSRPSLEKGWWRTLFHLRLSQDKHSTAFSFVLLLFFFICLLGFNVISLRNSK